METAAARGSSPIQVTASASSDFTPLFPLFEMLIKIQLCLTNACFGAGHTRERSPLGLDGGARERVAAILNGGRASAPLWHYVYMTRAPRGARF